MFEESHTQLRKDIREFEKLCQGVSLEQTQQLIAFQDKFNKNQNTLNCRIEKLEFDSKVFNKFMCTNKKHYEEANLKLEARSDEP